MGAIPCQRSPSPLPRVSKAPQLNLSPPGAVWWQRAPHLNPSFYK
jgi:hypothetical protein